tara:strand:- start:531 stop:803 length:273 start_codon:yes stop_codon:yes gene_type:complete
VETAVAAAQRRLILVEAVAVEREVTQETVETAGLEIVIHCPERRAQAVAVVEEKAAARVLAAAAVWGYKVKELAGRMALRVTVVLVELTG